jgi:hypothetical protein
LLAPVFNKPEQTTMAETTAKPVLLPDPAVARRYGVHPMTLRRWDKNRGLGFPPVIMVNNRRYREVAKLDAWDLRNSREAAQLRAGRTPLSPEA